MNKPVLANYHTHTPLCLHATGRMEEYLRSAIDVGYTVLGFADHAPWPYRSGFDSSCRMHHTELAGYVQELERLRRKYAGQITLYIGLEAEYFPDYLDWLRQQAETLPLDYLILGNHFDRSDEYGLYFGGCTRPDEIHNYVRQTIKGMQTGMFRYLAHPDLFLNRYPVFDSEAEKACHALCEAAAGLDMPLEYNLLGEERQADPHYRRSHPLGYNTPMFWKIAAQYPIKAIVGCDAHQPDRLKQVPLLRQVQQQLSESGITVLQTLPGLE